MNALESRTAIPRFAPRNISEVAPASERSSPFVRLAGAIWSLVRSIHIRRHERILQLCETLPLGEKRLLAVVQVGRQRLLIAATGQAISVLQQLESPGQAPPPLAAPAASEFRGEGR